MRAKYMCSARVQICVYLFCVAFVVAAAVATVDIFVSVSKFTFFLTFVIAVVVLSIYFRQIYLFDGLRGEWWNLR